MDRKKIYKNKRYTHFDNKKGIDSVKHLVENPIWVSHHGFYPFIHYDIRMVKYSNNIRKDKFRSIYYSAHVDRYIYALYSYKINMLYNDRAKRDCINRCSIAYRTCLHKNNIDFAKEVFDFAKSNKECYIIIGDFTKFFERLDHKYLKSRLLDLLNVSILPDDYYAVYKNLTKYAYVDYDDLLQITGLNRKEFGKLRSIMDMDKFRIIKSKYINRNLNSYGIPQGAAISSVLSNVYMLEFDKKINNYATSHQCLYRRYCDDFILVIPKKAINSLSEFWGAIKNIIDNTPMLDLQEDKTQIFELSNSKITNINSTLLGDKFIGKDVVAYLGFTFDGFRIQIRDKTIHKYYNRLYHKIEIANKYSEIYKRNVFRKSIYEKYTHLGNRNPNYRKCGFLSYVDRAAKIFDDNSIKLKTKNHFKKIGKRLKDMTTLYK